MRLDAVDVDDEAFLEPRLVVIADAGGRIARRRTSSSKSSPAVEAAIVSPLGLLRLDGESIQTDVHLSAWA